MLIGFGAVAYPANYKQFPRFIDKTVAGHTYRLIHPIYGPWGYACSRGWDVASRKMGAAGELALLVKSTKEDQPGVSIEKYVPPAGTFSAWINEQKAAGKGVVIDLDSPTHESLCVYQSQPGAFPIPTAARAVATTDVAEAARITNANPQAFVFFEPTAWKSSGGRASRVVPIALGVGVLVGGAWLLTRRGSRTAQAQAQG